MRKTPSLAEKLLWSKLRNQRNGIVFRRQQVVGPFIADFFCSRAKLVIELDGWSHDETVTYDAARTNWLECEGYKVVRLWNMDVVSDAAGAASALFLYAEELINQLPYPRFCWTTRHNETLEPPHPHPLPRRREGTASNIWTPRDETRGCGGEER